MANVDIASADDEGMGDAIRELGQPFLDAGPNTLRKIAAKEVRRRMAAEQRECVLRYHAKQRGIALWGIMKALKAALGNLMKSITELEGVIHEDENELESKS